jgi:hypothetical protein
MVGKQKVGLGVWIAGKSSLEQPGDINGMYPTPFG